MISLPSSIYGRITFIAVSIDGAEVFGVAIATLILKIGLGNVILVDKQGILTADMDLTSGQRGLIDKLNKEGKTGNYRTPACVRTCTESNRCRR